MQGKAGRSRTAEVRSTLGHFCLLTFAFCLLLFFFTASPATAQRAEAPDRSIFEEIDRSLKALTEISGMKVRRKIPYDLISRENVHRFLRDRIKEVAPPEELRIEELALKKLGFVPPEFDLAKTTIDLLTEQAAAFYDFHRKKLYLTDWTPSAMRQAALVHELAHALADQNFHLERFIRDARSNDDRSMARMAVMEGQATWLMSESIARQAGQSLKNSPDSVENMSRAMQAGAGLYPVFDAAPLYLQKTLIFPYTQGVVFQNAVFRKLDQAAFAQVFRRPPVSTQQILHPEKYLSEIAPTSPPLPAFEANHGYRRRLQGTLGELDHSILLTQYGGSPQAEEISPHWKGGAYALHERKADRRVVLAYASEWDDASAARQFFDFYEQVLRKKWRKMEITSRARNTIAGVGDDGYFVVRLEGPVVSSLEGMPGPAIH